MAVLLQPAKQIGERGVEIGCRDHRRVEPQAAGGVTHGRVDARRHPLQHLEFHPLADPAGRGKQVTPGDVEQVVAGYPDP